ncbi:MAG: glycosyl hydrolase [Cytophagaceae bacterium]
MRYTFLISLFILFSQASVSQQIFPGGIPGVGGSFNLTYPPENCPDPGACNFDLFNLVGGGNTAAMTKGSTYRGPFQTHNWWNSALWNVAMEPCVGDITTTVNLHSGAMYPIPPLILEAEPYGIVLRYRPIALNGGGPNNTGNFFADEDIIIGFNGATCSRTSVMDYGDMHVKLEQDMGGGNRLYTIASQGSPFVQFEKQGSAEPTFFLFFLKATAVSSSGNSFTFDRSCCPAGTNPHFGRIALFFPPGTQISNDGLNYISINSLPTNGSEYGGNNRHWRIRLPAGINYFSSAIMPDGSQQTLDYYEQYAFNYITDTRFTYNYNQNTATLTNTFSFTCSNVLGAASTGTLMALYQHQYRNSPQYPSNATGHSYSSSRGPMQVIHGSQFNTVMKNYGFLPALGWANTADSLLLYNLAGNFANAANHINFACGNPVYGSFGALHEAARIAEIAHAVGNYPARNKLLNIAKTGIQNWLSSPDGKYLGMYHYDKNFNWLTPFPSAFDADRLLQDSHFHHGYLVYAAAIVARFESVLYNSTTWATQWGPMIEETIRNINDYRRLMDPPADPNKPWYPYLRYFDPYAGHSWAGHDASNQESVSESLNFAAGAALWGETVGNNEIRDMGIMLYVNESEAARLYWWDGARTGVNRAPYAPNYNHYHGAILAPGGVAYATFFGASPYYVHGITYVPITGSSLWMAVDSLGAANQFADFVSGFGNIPEGSGGFWATVMLMEQAVYDAATAKNEFLTKALPQGWGGHDYMVEGLYWISTFDSVGVVDAGVQADVPNYAVFRKGQCKHYMVYNAPGKGERVVNFTDGRSFNVPADTIITFKVCDETLPVNLITFNGQANKNFNKLKWCSASEENFSHYEIEKSINGKDFYKLTAVNGKGGKVQNEYVFDDFNPEPYLNFYRLKMIDQDGRYSYSRIVALSTINQSEFNVFPNPAENTLYVQKGTAWDNISISISDELGRVVFEEIFLRGNFLEINFSSLAKGIYFIKIIEEDRISIFKIFK